MTDGPYVPKRVWQTYLTEEWRTDFPPPLGFDGEEKGEWQDGNYSRSLTAAELAAVTAGNPDEEIVTLDQDEADRDAFFAAFALIAPPPADGRGTNSRKPPKSEPPKTPGRSRQGASKPGDTP